MIRSSEEEEFTDKRAKRLAERLKLLSDAELKRFEDHTVKQKERIAERLGLDTTESRWMFVSLSPEEHNAFFFAQIRWLAGFIELRRRLVANYRHQPHYATGPGCY